MTNTSIEVIGRNGYRYAATHIAGSLYTVGKFIVEVENGKCVETVCKATKANTAWAIDQMDYSQRADQPGW